MWTTIYLNDAFSQIPMEPATSDILATSTPLGVLYPRCMPQGYKNSPPVWQRMIEWVLQDVRDTADPYIDDIIIGTTQPEDMTDDGLMRQHGKDVRRVLKTLQEAKLVADHEKRCFFVKELNFVGIGCLKV